MGKTNISWTDHSINPVRARDQQTNKVGHHCEKVSPGCQNCYASALQTRFGLTEFAGPSRRETLTHFLDESKLQEVLRRKKPTKFFWCDMSDLFGTWVPDEWIAKCFAVMALTPQHTHQVLTKRPDRMRRFVGAPNVQECVDHVAFHLSHKAMLGGYYDAVPDAWPLPNVWLGVSVEDQQRADERIPLLLGTPATVRFLSVEPLLGPVDVLRVLDGLECKLYANWLHQIIIGGESGHRARPCEVEWITALAWQGKAAGVAVFVKQDCGPRPGMQGGIPDDVWALKEFPERRTSP